MGSVRGLALTKVKIKQHVFRAVGNHTIILQTHTHQYSRVLSIAGSDSGGGAGIQADLKTIAALGCYGMTAVTALTAQNTLGVRSIHGVPPQMLRDQIDAVLEDIGVDAVKIGMLHSSEIVLTVAQAIDRHVLLNVVFDPVMVATSGATLIDHTAMGVLIRELFPRVAVITPNLDEAALLVGRPLTSKADMALAAELARQDHAPSGAARHTLREFTGAPWNVNASAPSVSSVESCSPLFWSTGPGIRRASRSITGQLRPFSQARRRSDP